MTVDRRSRVVTAPGGAPVDTATRLGLVGAGRVGTDLLHLLASAPSARVVVVAEADPAAPGMTVASARGIPVVRSLGELAAYAPEVVIDAAERPASFADLVRAVPAGVEVVGPRSARLLRDLVALRIREAQLLEKAETIRRMTGGVFHSLNNVFAALVGRTGLLLRLLEGGRWTPTLLIEWLRALDHAVNRGIEILRRLRGLTGESADEPVTQVAADALMREVVALTDPFIREAQARGAMIEIRQELAEAPPVLGRASDLLEVLVNVVVNAIEAMPEGGDLTLATARDGASVVIRVEDTGVGIPEDVRLQLFTPFFTTKPHGTGLGLSVAREIVRRHGGEIEVASTSGKGTRVTIRLPVAGSVMEQEVAAQGLRGWRVLVADDDALVRDLLVKTLAQEGCQVLGVSGGRAALAALTSDAYDLVLADVAMPGVPAWQVAQAAREAHPSAIVILSSPWDVGPERPPLDDLGADALVRKPVRVQELTAAVRAVLAHRADGTRRDEPRP